jgi:hypothetical protein
MATLFEFYGSGFGGGVDMQPSPLPRPQPGTVAHGKWTSELEGQLKRIVDETVHDMPTDELVGGMLNQRVKEKIEADLANPETNRPFFEDLLALFVKKTSSNV